MKTQHELYQDAVAADEAWSAALISKFKGNAGDMRYSLLGKSEDLAPLFAEFARATSEWRKHPGNCLSEA